MANGSDLVDSYGLYINGKWVDGGAGRYDDVSPVTEEPFASAPNASVAQVEAAIGAARDSFDEGTWTRMGAEERASCLTQLGAALTERAEDFYALSQVEWGCTNNERPIQIDGPAFMASQGAELAAMPAEERVESMMGPSLIGYEPLGVVSIITPWNFPHTLNVMKLSAALAAGNTVVLKPSPLTPLAALALARVVDEQTDIPAGVVNVVTPDSVEASRVLTTDPRVDMVSFTGSSTVGRQVMSAAGQTMKRILLECGGKSASIFLDDVELSDELLERILFECCTLHAGQACILHSRLLLPEALHDEVVSRLAALANAVKVGDPADPEVQVGPLISEIQRERVQSNVNRAVDDGAKIAAGGKRPADLETGYYYRPTILTNVLPESFIAQEEVFGPVLAVLKYTGDDEAVSIANNTAYGLSGAVWGADVERALGVARRLRTGQVAVNGSGPGAAPFGGFKQSGLGREGGVTGLHQYMETRAIGLPA